MNGKLMLYMDQYGEHWYARSVRELYRKLGGRRPTKMYIDKKDGSAVHIGYVVGRHWCTMFAPVELPA
jgi:hypothetical protein